MRVVDQGLIYDAAGGPPTTRACTFPSLMRLESGRLVAAFRTGSTKDCPDEDVRVMTSADEGHSWQTAFTGFGEFPTGSGGRIRGMALAPLPGERLLASLLWVDHSDPTLPLASPETQGILHTVVLVAESTDGGCTWHDVREVLLAPHRGNATTGGILGLKDGSLALPYEAWKEYHDPGPGEHHASLRLSHDGGQTWPDLAIVAHDPTGRLLYWDQRLAVSPDDGRLLAMFWTHDRAEQQDRPMHLAWGSPTALDWDVPRTTGIDGQICAPLVLPGGRVFAAYVHRHDPPSLRAILSADLGQTWSGAPELIFYEKRRGGQESGMGGRRDFGDYWADMSIWTFGHPAPLLLPDGSVMVAFYAGDAAAMSIHWVRIEL